MDFYNLDLTNHKLLEGRHLEILNRWLRRHESTLAQLEGLSWRSSGASIDDDASASAADGEFDVRLSLNDRAIDLRGKRLRPADVRMLITWCEKENAQRPQELFLGENVALGDDAIATLLLSNACCAELTRLDLSGCGLGTSACEHVAALLKNMLRRRQEPEKCPL